METEQTRLRARRPLWPVVAAIVAPPLLAGVALLLFGLPGGAESQPGDMWVGGTGPGPASTAPPAETAAAHEALHSLGDQCRAAAPDPAAVTASLDVPPGFALRYPIGRFAIDDETATAASLLRVVRDVLVDCAPDRLDRIDATLLALEAGPDPS